MSWVLTIGNFNISKYHFHRNNKNKQKLIVRIKSSSNFFLIILLSFQISTAMNIIFLRKFTQSLKSQGYHLYNY